MGNRTITNNNVTAPYDRVYFLGNSLSSIRTRSTKVNITHLFGEEVQHVDFPHPQAYYNGQFSNGPNFFTYLKRFMPELPLCDQNNFSYQGSKSEGNTANHYAAEKKREVLKNLSWIEGLLMSTIITSMHPGFDAQFDKIIAQEKQFSFQGNPLVILWYGGHNDIISLPFVAGYKYRWTNLPDITERDVRKLSRTLLKTAHYAGRRLCRNIIKLHKVGMRSFVWLNGLPIHLTPHFMGLKKRYRNVRGFSRFIDNMANTYSNLIRQYLRRLESIFKRRRQPINVTCIKVEGFIRKEDLVYLHSDKNRAFLDEDDKRNGSDYNLWHATAEDVQKMGLFYDPIHLASKAARRLAEFVAKTLRRKEPNIYQYLEKSGSSSRRHHSCRNHKAIRSSREYKNFIRHLSSRVRRPGPDIKVNYNCRTNPKSPRYASIRLSKRERKVMGCVICIEGYRASELKLEYAKRGKDLVIIWKRAKRRRGSDRGIVLKGFGAVPDRKNLKQSRSPKRSDFPPIHIIHKEYNTWSGAKFLATINGPNGYEFAWGRNLARYFI